MKLNVLGVDPSFRNFGYAHGWLDTETMHFELSKLMLSKTENEKDKAVKKVVRKNSEDLERARLLYNDFQELMKYADFVFVEVPVGSQSARAMASYGVCIGILASCKKPLIQVTPYEVKLAATGIKTATKSEMIEVAMQDYPHTDWLLSRGKPIAANEHLADALFAIKAGIESEQFRQVLALIPDLRSAA